MLINVKGSVKKIIQEKFYILLYPMKKSLISTSIKLGFLTLFIFFFGKIYAQNPGQGNADMSARMKIGRLYGKVVDSTSNKAVEFASVQLIGSVFDTASKQMKNGVIVSGQLTQENGEFSLEKINVMGKYTMKIASIGYETKEFSLSFGVDPEKMKNGGGKSMMGGMDKDLGNIKLNPKTTQLKEVEIVSTAPVMELKLDKKVFNVEKNMIATGGTAEDVLKQVPSVSVDMDGNVSLRNAAPQLFVDGKPTVLTIDQIPADAIQSVEVITNPSSKYDASGGQGGILNIVLKKDRRIGYNGNIRAGIDQRGKISGGADVNIREGKINTFISGHANQRKSISEGNTERQNLISNPLTNISQNSYAINKGLFLHTRGGIDWFMSNRNTLTVSGNYLKGKFEPTDSLHTRTDTLPGSNASGYYYRLSETKREFYNVGGSLQFKHLYPKEGKELTADLNYNKTSFDGGGNYETKYFDSANDPIGNNTLQQGEFNGYTEIISAQTDYIHPLTDKSKIEAGVLGTYRDFLSKSNNFLKNDSTGEFDLLKGQSTHYKFNDQIYAGYLTYSTQKDKFSYQLGLRAESSFYLGELVDSNKTFRTYFPASFFPSGSATYVLNGQDNFQLSYSRRIKRPAFLQLIPFTDYSDSLNLNRGNAALKPEFTHSLEFSYLKVINPQNNILFSTYFKNSTGLITNYQANEYDTVLMRNAIINTYKNANASYIYGGELTSKHSIMKWLEFTLNLNVYYSVIDAKNIEVGLTNEQFSWFAKANFTIKLPKNFSIQLSPEYRSESAVPVGGGGGRGGWWGGPIATTQGYEKARYEVDAAIKYEFMKNKAANISLNVRDIFATDVNKTVSSSHYFNQTSARLRDPQFARLNFSYRFGKFDSSLFKRKNMKVNTDGGMQ